MATKQTPLARPLSPSESPSPTELRARRILDDEDDDTDAVITSGLELTKKLREHFTGEAKIRVCLDVLELNPRASAMDIVNALRDADHVTDVTVDKAIQLMQTGDWVGPIDPAPNSIDKRLARLSASSEPRAFQAATADRLAAQEQARAAALAGNTPASAVITPAPGSGADIANNPEATSAPGTKTDVLTSHPADVHEQLAKEPVKAEDVKEAKPEPKAAPPKPTGQSSSGKK